MPITLVRWNSGLAVGLVAFIAAAIGRFTSPVRTVVAGLALGVIESMASGLISSQYRSAYVYGVLVVYLLVEDAFGHDGLVSRLRARWASSSGPVAGGEERPVLVTAGSADGTGTTRAALAHRIGRAGGAGVVGGAGSARRGRLRAAGTRRSSRCSARSRPPGS